MEEHCGLPMKKQLTSGVTSQCSNPTKRGPAPKPRLEGEAAIYKQMLDREQLLSPENGVEYFKRTLRPYCVKGAKNFFPYRLFAIFKKSGGQQDLLRAAHA